MPEFVASSSDSEVEESPNQSSSSSPCDGSYSDAELGDEEELDGELLSTAGGDGLASDVAEDDYLTKLRPRKSCTSLRQILGKFSPSGVFLFGCSEFRVYLRSS